MCPYEIPRTEWAADSVASKDGIDNMTIKLLANDVNAICLIRTVKPKLH